jgi:hypothetical protein
LSLETSFQVPCSFAGAASPGGRPSLLLVDDADAVGAVVDAPFQPTS